MNELLDQLFLQMVKDIVRVVMVIDAIYVVWLVGMATNWLLNQILNGITKGSKAIGRLMKKLFRRTEVAVIAEQNVEV